MDKCQLCGAEITEDNDSHCSYYTMCSECDKRICDLLERVDANPSIPDAFDAVVSCLMRHRGRGSTL